MISRFEWDRDKAAGNISKPDDMQPEYDFDYGKARSNRFAEQMDRDQLVAGHCEGIHLV